MMMLFSIGMMAEAQTTVSYTTKADGSKLLEKATGTTSNVAGTSNVITLNGNNSYQSIDGFGYAITYSSCYNLLKMSKSSRTALLKKIYSPTSGYGTSYARISIGCNDFSSREYTLCDTQGLQNFALQSDELNYVIPILKEILAINPNLKIMATPWTCPRWMKVNNLTDKAAHNRWTDGHLNPDYYQTYADYFVKFVQAMKGQGINIYAVTPQNEPLNQGNCASLYMPWNEEAAFIRYLAADFHNNGIKTKIYVYDHNFNYDNKSGQNDYPIQVYNALGSGYTGEELVVGSAYHDYGGSPSEMGDIHSQNTGKEVIFSEESIGTWNNGRDLSATLVSAVKRSGITFLQNWARAVMVWNLMLDTNNGPNLDGGCQTCYGAIDINPGNYSSLSYNNHYYLISHLSSVIKSGAVRIATSGWWANDMSYIAFRNTDGSYAMLFASSNSADQNFTVTDGSQYMNVCVPANSVVSVRFGNFSEQAAAPYDGVWIIGAKSSVGASGYTVGDNSWSTANAMALTQENDHTYSIELTVGQQLNKDNVNFKFFGQAGWGVEFTSTGTYKISTSSDIFGIGTGSNGHDDGNIYLKSGKTLTNGDTYKFSVDISNPNNAVLTVEKVKPYEGIWIIGAKSSVGASGYTAGDNSWSTANAMALTQTGDHTYSIDLTVGQQLNKDNVNFKFFGQAGWGIAFNTTGTYKISSSSDIFGIGTGSNGHDDGNIYLKSGKTLTNGDTYTFTIDASDPFNVVLSVTRARLYEGIWIIGAKSSVGATSYVSGDNGWSTANAIPLTANGNNYEIALTVGTQLNKNYVNFKFFGQAGWGIEFTSTGNYRISTNSSVFGIGTGSNGHDNGNVYLKDGQTLTDGDVYLFSINAEDQTNVVLTVTKQSSGFQETGANLALNKSASTSGTEGNAYAASNAVDGNMSSRWSSAFNDNQYITIDLGANYVIDRTVICWEAAYASQYKLQVSTNGSSFTTVKTVNCSGGTDEQTFSPVTARYVRMQGVTRALSYGYSIYEFQVYGMSANAKSALLSDSEVTDVKGVAVAEIKGSDYIYNMNGVKVGTMSSLSALPKGIYIVNGKKIVKK